MKTNISRLLAITSALLLGAVSTSAQSPAPLTHVSRSAAASGDASSEAVAAAGGSGEASARIVGGVVAVPVWTLGAIGQGSGEAVKISGAASVDLGKAAARGADKLWDFATGDAAARPPMDRGVGVPPAKSVQSKDPSPAAVMRGKF